jgi:O-antigen ligase
MFHNLHQKIRSLRIEVVFLCLALLAFPLDMLISLTGFQNVGQEGLTLTRLFFMLSFGTYIIRALWLKDSRMFSCLFDNPVSIILICYFAVSILSILFSRSPSTMGIHLVQQRFGKFLLYYLLISVIKDRRILKLCIASFVISIVFPVTAGFYEMISGNAVISEIPLSADLTSAEGFHMEYTGNIRIQGLSSDPDLHVTQIVAQFGLLLFLLVTAGSRKLQIILGLLLLVVMLNIFSAGSRSAWLAFFFSIFLFIGISPLRYKNRVLVGIVGAGLVALIGMLVLFPRIAFHERIWGNLSYNPLSFRVELSRVALEMFKQYPLFGIGEGCYINEFHRFAKNAPSMPRKFPPNPHNVYLGIIAEVGLIGLTVVCLLHLAIAMQIINSYRKATETGTKILAAGLLASFIGFWICIQFNVLWENKYGWAIMGFSGALARVTKVEHEGVL